MMENALVSYDSRSSILGILTRQAECSELKEVNQRLKNEHQRIRSIVETAKSRLDEATDHNMQIVVGLDRILGARSGVPCQAPGKNSDPDEKDVRADMKYLYHQILSMLHRAGYWADNELMQKSTEAFQKGDKMALLRCYFLVREKYINDSPLPAVNKRKASILDLDYFNLCLLFQYYELNNEYHRERIETLQASEIYQQYIAGEEQFTAFCDTSNASLRQTIRQKEEQIASQKANLAVIKNEKGGPHE